MKRVQFIKGTTEKNKILNKGIKLHNLSHHPTSVKEECVKNFYKTAERTSSGPS